MPPARIIRTRRKTVALIIDPDGSLIVRAPLRCTNQHLADIIREKTEWIRAQQEEILKRQKSYQPHEYCTGERFWFLGEQFPLELVHPADVPLKLDTHFKLDERSQRQGAKVFETWYRYQARMILTERSTQIANQQGFRIARLRISSARTRWGSCSNRGTISLVWRLVMAPLPVIEYVILHELTHLKIHNHSRAFWSQVEAVMPDYRSHRAWLKKNGFQLTL